MERVMVAVAATVLILLTGFIITAEAMNPCPIPTQCGPQRSLITKMIPCVRTEMVAEVVPCTRVVPVKRIGYKIQNVMLKGIPVGPPCADSCTKCCPQPFCQVVQQKVPYEYYEPVTVPWYNVVYKPVCRPVMVPQTYMVEAVPMCGR